MYVRIYVPSSLVVRTDPHELHTANLANYPAVWRHICRDARTMYGTTYYIL